ncbi:MAG: YdeI/OmpD-associated family protein [Acidobacteriota bacterium]|nr:YdeI/OmpD-associated family protein [Acidobacteriota bacterium]
MNQSRSDGPQLWSATATVPNARNGSTVHSGSIKETAGGMAVLRRACALTSATVYRGWIESAKREETKARRLKEAIRLLAAGKPLGLK